MGHFLICGWIFRTDVVHVRRHAGTDGIGVVKKEVRASM
jgi:hypothetical protein